jgi:hypothetical protein
MSETERWLLFGSIPRFFPPIKVVIKMIRGRIISAIFLSCALIVGHPNRSHSGEIPPQVQQLLGEIPACSRLHELLERGEYGDGIDQPYMQAMRKEGVQRVHFFFTGTLRGRNVEKPLIVRRLYFEKYDAPNAQITDETALKRLQDSGLEAMVDQVALDRVRKAPFLEAFDIDGIDWARLFGIDWAELLHIHRHRQWYAYVELFSSPWLLELRTRVHPLGKDLFPLTIPVINGDSIEVERLLRESHFNQSELDGMLFAAAGGLYDNTAVINLLIKAGANMNAGGDEGKTPLISAFRNPCNLVALLKNGADVNARDDGGETALKRARDRKNLEAIRILEQAGARE